MKKTIKHPDGKEEVIEGTAEELAEYEKNINESGKKKNPKLLTEQDVDAFQKLIPYWIYSDVRWALNTPFWYAPMNVPYIQVLDPLKVGIEWELTSTTGNSVVGTDGKSYRTQTDNQVFSGMKYNT